MRYYLLIMMCIITTTSSIAQSDKTFEIGVILGEPTGISGKYWLNESNAIDGAIGWSFSDWVVDLATDYLFHLDIFNVASGKLPIYFGLGLGLQLGERDDGEDDDTFFGARIPIGLTYLFENVPFSLFGEVAPIMEVIPETDFRVSGGLGIRLAF